MPRRWRRWLEDRGSLTQRLIAASGGDFHVEILRQFIGQPTPDEARALGLGNRRRGLIREVLLIGNGVPWVFARSVLPLATLTGRRNHLRHLDDRPLGQELFSDNSMHREPVEIARIDSAALPLLPTQPAAPLWGRRSVFRLDGKPLLVAEIFLADFDPDDA